VQAYPIPGDEQARLATLQALGALKRTGDPVLDNAVAVARQLFHTPVALVSLVARDTQHFVARCGLDVAGSSREASICTHAIMQRHALVVHDAAADPRTRDNPLVTGAPHIAFYAGAPIIMSDGVRLGAVCVIDFLPRREADPAALIALEALAGMVARHLETIGRESGAQTVIDRALDEARREVLGMVGEQLRTPASLMRAAAAQSRFGPSDGAEGLRAGADHLERLADRVGAFADRTPDRLGLEETTVQLDRLLERCAAMASLSVEARGLTLTVGPATGLGVHADPTHLTTAIYALLQVAIVDAQSQIALKAVARPDDSLSIDVTHDGDTGDGALTLSRRLIALHGGEARPSLAPLGETRLSLSLPAWRRIGAPAVDIA
jgi:GAF domain-containing protein